MKKNFLFLIFSGVLLSCNNNTRPPDVSSIKVELLTRPFEQDFFAMDTANIGTSLEKIMQKYPGFTGDFIYNILGLNLDSMIHGNKEQQMAVKQFIRDYMPIKDSADVLYKDFKKYSGEIQKGLQYVKYYFPDYQLPKSVITFVGPLDANFQTSFGVQGDVLTPDGLGIGLQLHLGGDFSFYKSAAGQSLYPAFISENFDADHIPINSMRNIADDLFEEQAFKIPNDLQKQIEALSEAGYLSHLIKYLEILQQTTRKLSRLKITSDYKIFLMDYEMKEVELSPLPKALYFLFLNHPKGISFKELPDYRAELMNIYKKYIIERKS